MATPTIEARGYVPTPYKQDPDETVTCPGCDRMNDTDASYCDQCDHPLTPTTAYTREPDETVLCPECRKYNDLDAHFCDQCGIRLEGRPDVTVEAPQSVGESEPENEADGVASSAFSSSTVPRNNLVRDVRGRHELREDPLQPGAKILTGIFSRYNQPYEISSFWEGDFVEIIAPGAFTQTIAEDLDAMRCLYDHGFDPTFGNKTLGAIRSVLDTAEGPQYMVGLLDSPLNNDWLIPALEGALIGGEKVGSLLGSSMRFEVLEDQWNNAPQPASWNPRGLPVRTVLRAKVYEFGPVTFPANPGATAFIARSRSDDWLKKVRDDEAFFASFTDRVGARTAQAIRRAVPASLPVAVDTGAAAARWAALRRRATGLLATSGTAV